MRTVVALVASGAVLLLGAPSALAKPTPVTWTVVEYTVSEDLGPGPITITRSSGKGKATIHYATADSDATAGLDYVATSGNLTFSSGQTQRSVPGGVVMINDSEIESRNEYFDVVLSNLPKGQVEVGLGLQKIVDDDGTVSLDTSEWAPDKIFQEDFPQTQAVTFKVTNSGTRESVDDIDGITSGAPLSGAFADGTSCTFDAESFACDAVAIDVGASSTIELHFDMPPCHTATVGVTLDVLADEIFGNENTSPTLTHSMPSEPTAACT